MLVKVFVIFHLVFIFDTTLSHGDHDDGDEPVFDHTRVCDDGKVSYRFSANILIRQLRI